MYSSSGLPGRTAMPIAGPPLAAFKNGRPALLPLQ
jgi:hypothetical protein